MKGLAERLVGRDSVSGTIAKIGILGRAEASEDKSLLNIQVTMDSGCSVYLVSSKGGVEAMLERIKRTATFVGEFVGEEKKNLFCDEVYFWEPEGEV